MFNISSFNDWVILVIIIAISAIISIISMKIYDCYVYR